MSEDKKPIKEARKLNVDGDTYWFVVGKRNVVIWDSDKNKVMPNHFELLGKEICTKEYFEWLACSNHKSITPADVVRYIRNNLK